MKPANYPNGVRQGILALQASKEFGGVDLYIYRRRVYAGGYEKRRNRT